MAAVHEWRPDIVGLSCLISTAYIALKETISLLRDAIPEKISPRAYVIGGQIDQKVCDSVKADYWTLDAMKGVRMCQEIMGA
jgi:methanogenic corrinoid protein MtbC1